MQTITDIALEAGADALEGERKVLAARLPVTLVERIVRIARRNQRTLTGEVVVAMEEHIRAPGGTGAVNDVEATRYYKMPEGEKPKTIYIRTPLPLAEQMQRLARQSHHMSVSAAIISAIEEHLARYE